MNSRLLSGRLFPFLRIGIYCLILPVSIPAQERKVSSESWKEAGLPYVENFGADDYNSHIENQAVVQDHRGLIYVANLMGVLEYDGISWRTIVINETFPIVRSLAVDSTNTVFVGCRGELGYLSPDSTGKLGFVSLLDSIPKDNRDFSDVRQTLAVRDGIYFVSSKYVFRWSDDRFKIFETDEHFQGGFAVGDSVYVRERNVGLLHLLGDSPRLIPDGAMFAQEPVYTMLPYDETTILIGSRKQGLFRYNGNSIVPFPTQVEVFLLENQLYHGACLPNGHFALGTLRGGVVIIDEHGRFRRVLNKATGLRNEEVHFVYSDSDSALWLALNNGLSRIEIATPFTIFTERAGIEGSVNEITRHRGTLYAATTLGVYYLQTPTSFSAARSRPRFLPVPGLRTVSWSLISVGNILLAGTSSGIYEIRKNGARRLGTGVSIALCFRRSRLDANRVYVGVHDGLVVLEFIDGKWHGARRFEHVTEEVRSIAEEADGTLWLGTAYQGLLKLDKTSILEKGSDAEVLRFDKEQGFPHAYVYVYTVRERAVFATLKGLWRYDETGRRFLPDSTFGAAFADSTRAFSHVIEDSTGKIWARSMFEDRLEAMLAVPRDDKVYRAVTTPFLRMKEIGDLWTVYPDWHGIVWFGGSEGTARYDATVQKDYALDYPTLIRRVQVISGDSLIYGGAPLSDTIYPELPFRDNALRFEFSAPSYDDVSANQYQFKLAGFDKDWSEWTKESKKDYTNLSEGSYTFRVRGRNVYRHVGKEAQFIFQILPPWYRTWWAYLFYVMVGIGFIALIVKSRVRHLQKKTEELEAIVAERTVTISEQAEKLKELDRMKSRFFANISHEFRTPLTLILGPLEKRLAKARTRSDKEELGMMHRSAGRVLELINQLLDLSRLEAGRMNLQVQQGNFYLFVKGIAMSFASLAEEKKITYEFLPAVEPCEGSEPSQGLDELYFDRDKVEKILTNLLSNAFKFTPEGGKVTVAVADSATATATATATVSVKNTGTGIPHDRLPYIFDRFYQADGSATREHEGTGIGLALTKELVELHHGTITVRSDDEETEFIVRLPVGRDHFSDDEISHDAEQVAPKEAVYVISDFTAPPEHATQPERVGDDDTIVLVVDDHPDVRRYISSYLAQDYQVIEAENGRAGVETAKDTVPDLVISDVMMPEMDGYELCSALKTDERTSHVPVILLTAKAGEEDKLSGLETGADDYLTKPFNHKELQARAHNLIEQRRKLRERFVREGMLRPREVAATSLDEAFLQRLLATLEEHIADEGFGVEDLSAHMAMGVRQLHRKVSALAGRTPVEFIRLIRLQRAKQLLEQKAGTVSEVAFQVGFSSLSYFSKTFKEEFGVLPSEI